MTTLNRRALMAMAAAMAGLPAWAQETTTAETPATPPAQAPTSSTLKPGVSAVAEARRAADAVVDARRSASAVAVVEPPRKTE